MSIAGGIEKAIERGLDVGCETIQIFTKSNNQWAAAPITDEQAAHFQSAWKASGIGPIFSHCAYLINVGSPKKETFEKSKQGLLVEVQRAAQLGLDFVVLHPGARIDSEEASCLKQIAETVAWVIDQTEPAKVKVLYEISAGQGTTVGHTFEELAALLKLTGRSKRNGICLDTCHLFAAGYDIRTESAYKKTLKEWDSVIGLDRIEAIHLNDSKKDLGCRVDRHEQIGKGFIGITAFECLMNDKRLSKLPMVLETPKDEFYTEDKVNLKLLRSLVGNHA